VAKPLPGRPELIGPITTRLRTVPTRVLATEEAATTDAQRQSQMGFQRMNQIVKAVEALQQVPFGNGQFLTVPDGSGGRNELITFGASGTYTIPHTLGRPVEGFVVVDCQTSGNHRIHRIARTRSEDERSVEFDIQAACSLKIWVW
jgi:hypothetical protein